MADQVRTARINVEVDGVEQLNNLASAFERIRAGAGATPQATQAAGRTTTQSTQAATTAGEQVGEKIGNVIGQSIRAPFDLIRGHAASAASSMVSFLGPLAQMGVRIVAATPSIAAAGVAAAAVAVPLFNLAVTIKLLRSSFGWAEDQAEEQLKLIARTKRTFPGLVGEGFSRAEEGIKTKFNAAAALFGEQAVDSMETRLTRQFTEYRMGKGLRGEKDIFARWGITPEFVQQYESQTGERMNLTNWLAHFISEREKVEAEIRAAPEGSTEQQEAIRRRGQLADDSLKLFNQKFSDVIMTWSSVDVARLMEGMTRAAPLGALPEGADQNARDFTVALRSVQNTFQQLKNGIAGDMMPIFATMMDDINNWMLPIQSGGQGLGTALRDLASALSIHAWETMRALIADVDTGSLTSLIDAFKGWDPSSTVSALASVVPLIKGVAGVVQQLASFIGWLDGIAQTLTDLPGRAAGAVRGAFGLGGGRQYFRGAGAETWGQAAGGGGAGYLGAGGGGAGYLGGGVPAAPSPAPSGAYLGGGGPGAGAAPGASVRDRARRGAATMPSGAPAYYPPAGGPAAGVPALPPELGVGRRPLSGGSSVLAQQRDRFRQELDPQTRMQWAALMASEQSGAAMQTVGETMTNRASAWGTSLKSIISNKAYYEPYQNRSFYRNLAALQRDPQKLQQIFAMQDAILAGSNRASLATHNASAGVAARARTTQAVHADEAGEVYTTKTINPQLHGAGVVAKERSWLERTLAALRGTPTETAPTPTGPLGAQQQPAGRPKMLFLHGMQSRYSQGGITKTPGQVEAEARRYANAFGFDLEVIPVSGDNTAAQAEAARTRLQQGDISSVLGFSAGGNTANRLRSEFPGVQMIPVGAGARGEINSLSGVRHMNQIEELARRAEVAAGTAQQPQFPTPPGGGGRIAELQQRVAGIRRLPIAPSTRQALEYAAIQAGVNVEVTSGGQARIGTGGPRTGSTRHDLGGAADVRLRDPATGRLLDMTNPSDASRMAQFMAASVRAGATGVGAGLGYMGKNTMHIGGGSVASWGGAPWVRGALAAGRANLLPPGAAQAAIAAERERTANRPVVARVEAEEAPEDSERRREDEARREGVPTRAAEGVTDMLSRKPAEIARRRAEARKERQSEERKALEERPSSKESKAVKEGTAAGEAAAEKFKEAVKDVKIKVDLPSKGDQERDKTKDDEEKKAA